VRLAGRQDAQVAETHGVTRCLRASS
jgi:hypothetical protein